MRKREIEAKQRRIIKEIKKLEGTIAFSHAELNDLAELHCGFQSGDEVVYVGPNPHSYMSGVVSRVAHGYAGSPAIVTVHLFKMGPKRELYKSPFQTRSFHYPERDLKLVRRRTKP